MRSVAVAVATLLLAAACGGAGGSRGKLRTIEEFTCQKRRAEYSATGGFGFVEAGVAISCSGETAKLDTWRVLNDKGNRKDSSFSLSQVEFEDLWKRIESTGWRNLTDCNNPGAADDDPAYTIDISDENTEVSLSCQGKELPFPFDRLVNELDLKAAGFQ